MKSIYVYIQTRPTPNCAICKWRGKIFFEFSRACSAQGERSTRDAYKTRACKNLYEPVEDELGTEAIG